jgi:hypothetical protein
MCNVSGQCAWLGADREFPNVYVNDIKVLSSGHRCDNPHTFIAFATTQSRHNDSRYAQVAKSLQWPLVACALGDGMF